MNKSDGLRIAAYSLIENPLRTFLTLLGIAIGVTAVILVVSVIDGLNGYVDDVISEDFGPDVFVVNRFGVITSREEFLQAARRNTRITEDEGAAIRRLATLVDTVAVSRSRRGPVRYGGQTITDVTVWGNSIEARDVETNKLMDGRYFAPSEITHSVNVCILGHDIADILFPNLDPLNRDVRIWGRSFRVLGVWEKRGSAFGQSRDNFVNIPITTMNKMFGSRDSVNLSVKVRDPARFEEALEETRMILRARRHLLQHEEDNFGVVTGDSIMSVWTDLTEKLFQVAIFVVSISLVVGGIVIMNIMMLTVVERTREIGVRKAVGARQKDIEFQFLLESVILCALGGLVGVALGGLGAWTVATYTPLPARFPIWAPVLAVVVTSAVGIFFGLHPARKAGLLDPIEALRSEQS